MSDIGTKKTEKEIKKVEKEIDKVYSEALSDINNKLDDFHAKFKVKEEIYLQKLSDGKITQEQYNNWVSGQVFQGEQWANKKNQILNALTNSNKVAVNMVNGGMYGVFAFNSNYQAYEIEKGFGVDFGFGLYDATTVKNLIKNDPQILPKWKINEKKDYIWNEKKLNNAITQGVIQGEGLDKIAKRISTGLCSQNENLMKTFARTGMTQAQNAGRYQRQMDAKKLGINMVKEWMATLDGRTRDSHRHMDGEQIKVGDKWHPQKFSNGCRYPGDPEAPPRETYNCRCTLVADLVDYPSEYERYDNIDGKPIKNMTYDQWAKAKGGVEYTKTKYKKKPITKAEKDQQNKLKTAQNELDKLQAQVDYFDMDKKFEDIWYNQTVTYADWENKKDSIQGKKDYYNQQIQKYTANGDHIMVTKMQNKLTELEEFETYGEEYSKILKDLGEAKKRVASLTPKPKASEIFGKDAYSQVRKDMAVWAKTQKDADNVLRPKAGEVWKNATHEQRDAIYEYTQSFHKFNEPLRGWEYGASNYSTGAGFKGVGNTDLNAGYANNGGRLNAMTDMIENSIYDKDIWLNRGCDYGGMDKFFNCDMSLLKNGTQKELEDALLGTTPTEYGFMSCGSSKGYGFNKDITLNVYAPSGTKMMYVEPFSAFGHGSGKNWDGDSTQSKFGTELETILQQGTKFRVIKVEKKSSKLYFDLEVIDQSSLQRWEG